MDQNGILSSLCYLIPGAKLDKMLLNSARNDKVISIFRLNFFLIDSLMQALDKAALKTKTDIEFDKNQTEKILVKC